MQLLLLAVLLIRRNGRWLNHLIQKVMRRLFLLLIVLPSFLFFFVSCSKEISDSSFLDSNSESALLYESSKFSCYSLAGKDSDAIQQELILVNDYPELRIYMEKKPQTRGGDDYDYSSVLDFGDNQIVTLYSKYSIDDNGYLLSYYTEENGTFSFLVPFSGALETRSKGQDVIDCMQDVYSNHGWLSVWVFVQTCFIPQTAVAFAVACVGKNL